MRTEGDPEHCQTKYERFIFEIEAKKFFTLEDAILGWSTVVVSHPQRIGDLARSALYANKPDNWILGESPGDDFGYDFQVMASLARNCPLSVNAKHLSSTENALSLRIPRHFEH
jgi:hypothetical protein